MTTELNLGDGWEGGLSIFDVYYTSLFVTAFVTGGRGSENAEIFITQFMKVP